MSQRKRIGILTFHKGYNHGGYLQAYCLCSELSAMGHDVEILDYKNAEHARTDMFKPWVYRNPRKLLFNWKKWRAFKKAFKKLPLSKKIQSKEEIVSMGYDFVFVGSDVVWNFSNKTLGHDSIYAGVLGKPNNIIWVAYAPSIGEMEPTYSISNETQIGLSHFHSVGVRDQATQSFISQYRDGEAQLVVDPTWLNRNDLTVHVSRARKYMLVYAYAIPSSYIETIVRFARENDMEIVGTGYYQPFVDTQLGGLDPFEWASLVANADYVVAGTFHGALYAIRENKPFVVIPQHAINSKLTRPLEIVGLANRVVENEKQLAQVIGERICYKDSKLLLESEVQYSKQYLRDVLEA